MFVGKDVAQALGYSDSNKAIRIHVDDEDKGGAVLSTPGGNQKVIFINESGLYLQTDAQFCQFETMPYGWRAAFKMLTRTYYHDYRLYTIRAIINRWAPPNENSTKRYIENVCRLTGIGADEPLGIPSDKPARWIMLGAAMGIQECGLEGFDWFAMLRGWIMARE